MTEKHRSTPTPPTGNRSDPGVTLTVTSWRADMRREWGQGMHKRPPPGSWFTPSTDEEILASITPPSTTTLTTTTTTTTATTTTTILTNHQNNITNNDTITATTTISTLLNNHSAAILDSPATTFEKILASFASNNDDSSQQQQQDQVSTSIATLVEEQSGVVVEQEHLKENVRQVPLPLSETHAEQAHANASNTLENVESNASENERVDNDDMEGRRIMIEELREQASNRGKKKRNSAWAVFTRYIDTRSAANVSNQSPLRPSRIVKKRHEQVLYVPYYSLRKKNCQMKMSDESGEDDSLPMMVRVHMIDGTVFTAQFCSSDTVRQVCEYVMQMAHGNHVSGHEHEDYTQCETNDNYCNFKDENNDHNDDDDIRLGYHHWWRVNVVGTAPNSYTNGIRICSRYPRRKFSQCDDWDITLKDAGLYPSASVFVEKDDQGFVLNYAPKYGYKSLFAPTK